MQALLLLVALTSSAPNYDVKAICAPSRDAALSEDKAGAYDQCVKEEQSARDQVRQMWNGTPAHARADCNYPGPVPESYVELLTCLQMEGGKGFGIPASTTGTGATQVPALVDPPK
jgi:hypothetical protein